MKIAGNKSFRRFLFFLGWLAIALAFATQLRLFTVRQGNPMSWPDVLIWEILRWSIWFFLTPVIMKLATRYPIRAPQILRSSGIHLLASIAVSFGHLILFSLAFYFVLRFITAFETSSTMHELANNCLIEIKKTFPSDLLRIFPFTFTLQFHIGILVYWFILIFHQTMEYHRRTLRLESQLAQAQLDALRMQVHPHFLFNTLNSISALLHQDPKAAEEMIGALGDFLRLTLKNRGEDEVSLKEELKFLQCYLDIEMIRLGGRLTTNFEIDPETLDARLPNLILQPIIENAIRHGIVQTDGAGRIDVFAERQDGRLLVQIKDNGPGIPDLGNFREGIGLSNTRARLEQMYGSRYRFELKRNPGTGLQVDLEIPYKR